MKAAIKGNDCKDENVPQQGHCIDSQKYPPNKKCNPGTPKSREEKFFDHGQIIHICESHTLDLREREKYSQLEQALLLEGSNIVLDSLNLTACLFSSGTNFLFCSTWCIYLVVITESETTLESEQRASPLLFSTLSLDITGDESTSGGLTVGGKHLLMGT